MKGKLRFYHSTMNAGKTANLLMKAHQFEQCGIKTLLLKPSFDTRDYGVIKSRAIKEERTCFVFSEKDDLYSILCTLNKMKSKNGYVVFIDEIQFSTPEQIKQIWMFAKNFNIDVYVFGLKTKADNTLFDPIPNLLIYADSVEELKAKCFNCNNKATTHLMFIDDKPVIEYSDSLFVGDVVGNVRYESMCQCCRLKLVKCK